VGCSGSLQAERHEWHDAEGVSRWQWFLIVDPSPALLQYLREQNTFGLVAGSFEPLAESPVWFRFDSQAVETFRSLDGGMHLAFRTKDHRIYASAHGFGFTKSTAMPKAVYTPGYLDSVGGLPNTSPSTPED
jgi:hypothetical protein